MADHDIAHLIQVIYEKYNESQKDKKRENRVYMTEDEFKENLAGLVKKSLIEDKYMLYNEIFRKISADALEIDSTGKITISSKVIVAAEKEVIRRQEENKKEKTQIVDSSKEENLNDIINMSKEEYDKLSYEEKRDKFADAAEYLFGSKEKAQEVFDEVSRSQTTTDQNVVIDAQQKVDNGETLNVADMQKIYGEDVKCTGDNKIQKNILDRTLLIQDLAQSNAFAAFYQITNESNIRLDTQFITAILYHYKNNKDNEAPLSVLVRNFLSNRNCTEEQINAMIQLAGDREKFELIAKGLMTLSIDSNIGRDFIRGDGLSSEAISQFYGGVTDVYQVFKGIVKDGINNRNITDNERISIESYIFSVDQAKTISSYEKGYAKIDSPEEKIMGKESKGLDVNANVSIESPENIFNSDATLEMEADFDASLAAISDMEPDMFAGMFDEMAEEMVFEEPTFEPEKVTQEETPEVVGDDIIAEGEQETQIVEEVARDELTEKEVKGIQVEDIAVDEATVNTMNNENLPKKITWVDKVRASVDAFGKNVKKAFGSFISAITGKGGENNSGANNSTSSTSSNAGQNKHVQEVKNFVPTVELNLKQAQQATKAAEESKKNNDARGTDEPTQDDSEIGE